MINKETGIHTFSLNLKSSYSEIQNIITENEHFRTNNDPLYLENCYKIATYKGIGVEMLLHQSLTHSSWITLIVNPSSLLARQYCPTKLFQPTKKEIKKLEKHLTDILLDIGVEKKLKAFKLSRVDLTENHYYKSKADVMKHLKIFKKSYIMPRYEVKPFGYGSENEESFRGANQHSWTIACGSCAFSVYDKTYELKERHKVEIDAHILRLELCLMRKRIRQCTKSKHWEEQLLEISKKQNKLTNNFLHRLYQDCDNFVSLEEMIQRIDESSFREKTKKKIRRLAKKMDSGESLTTARKKMRMKNKDFIVLLNKFRKLDINSIPFSDK